MTTGSKMAAFAKQFADLKDRKADLDEQLKATNKALKYLTETTLPEYMDDNEIKKVTIDGVGTVFLQTKTYASVLAEDREALYEHLREKGDDSMIQDWVFPATLTAYCKEALEKGQDVPPMCKTTLIETAMLRRKS